MTGIDEPEPSLPERSPPRAVDVVGRAIDLNLGGSAQIRRASIYAGLLFLAAIGPLAALLVAHSIRAGGFDWIIDLIALGRTARVDLGPFAGLVVIVGVGCAIAISVDVQLLAIALIGSRAADRSIDLHAAIGLARRRFWRLVLASIAVGLILIIPRQILATALGNQNAESGVLLSTALDIVLSAPFAYVGAAVVLAPATPLQAVRWSWRMARRRWRLAFLIGVVNTAVSYLAGFAVSAGLDILIRIAIGLGIDRGLGTVQSIELVAIVAVAIVAIGSLTMTIAALTVGPQVVAWLGLGGPVDGIAGATTGGLTEPTGPDWPRRLVSRPMQVALVVEAAAALASVLRGS
ncbi:MAG: hypothetical protein E6I26_02035 [Chloroflexi bacterium]|nr:MAG: hypothetical protein E6I26_02035 [Chloroflexota bacterium]